MKNIHVLPTDKPSRLHNTFGILRLEKGLDLSPCNLNIYITSDEEIKEGDWYLNGVIPTNQRIIKSRGTNNTSFYKSKDVKKIILTTDQDLIKDGVQAIDDEFLEWFVKNPSCEEVVVERETAIGYAGDRQRTFYGKYKIIIPKEEPNQQTIEDIIMEYHQTAYGKLIEELRKQEQKHHIIDLMKLDEEPKQDCKHDIVTKYGVAECQNCGMEESEIVREEPKQEMRKVCKCKRAYENPLSEICSLCWNELYPNEKDKIKDEDLLEPKQETLEEVAERLVKEHPDFKLEGYTEYQNGRFNGIIEGIEWQQEQDKKMYSEEELRNAMNWMLTQYFEFHEWPAMGRVDHYIQSIKQQEQ